MENVWILRLDLQKQGSVRSIVIRNQLRAGASRCTSLSLQIAGGSYNLIIDGASRAELTEIKVVWRSHQLIRLVSIDVVKKKDKAPYRTSIFGLEVLGSYFRYKSHLTCLGYRVESRVWLHGT